MYESLLIMSNQNDSEAKKLLGLVGGGLLFEEDSSSRNLLVQVYRAVGRVDVQKVTNITMAMHAKRLATNDTTPSDYRSKVLQVMYKEVYGRLKHKIKPESWMRMSKIVSRYEEHIDEMLLRHEQEWQENQNLIQARLQECALRVRQSILVGTTDGDGVASADPCVQEFNQYEFSILSDKISLWARHRAFLNAKKAFLNRAEKHEQEFKFYGRSFLEEVLARTTGGVAGGAVMALSVLKYNHIVRDLRAYSRSQGLNRFPTSLLRGFAFTRLINVDALALSVEESAVKMGSLLRTKDGNGEEVGRLVVIFCLFRQGVGC
jgi:hypothetical protein